MAINKKLVHFNRKVIYEDKLNNGELMDPNLVFVKNTNEIYALNNGYQFVG
jgi:hypothetical protein